VTPTQYHSGCPPIAPIYTWDSRQKAALVLQLLTECPSPPC
jgi:hypothetical protein